MLFLIGLARIPAFMAGGWLAADLYMRGVWWLLEQRDQAITDATP